MPFATEYNVFSVNSMALIANGIKQFFRLMILGILQAGSS